MYRDNHMPPWLYPVSVLGCWFEPRFELGGGEGVIKLVSPAIASQISLNNVQRRPKTYVISNVHINLDGLAL